jgi:hypothetical protein
MKQITYKYKVGETVKFKDKYHPTATCGLHERAGTTAKISGYAPSYYNKPHYYLEGIVAHVGDRVINEVFPEEVFTGLVESE